MSDYIEWGPWIEWTDADREKGGAPVDADELVQLKLPSGWETRRQPSQLLHWGVISDPNVGTCFFRVRADHPIYQKQEQDTGEWRTAASGADVPANAINIKYQVKPIWPVKCWACISNDGSFISATKSVEIAEAWLKHGFTVIEGTFTPNEVKP